MLAVVARRIGVKRLSPAEIAHHGNASDDVQPKESVTGGGAPRGNAQG
jgi:hypothetical protein